MKKMICCWVIVAAGCSSSPTKTGTDAGDWDLGEDSGNVDAGHDQDHIDGGIVDIGRPDGGPIDQGRPDEGTPDLNPSCLPSKPDAHRAAATDCDDVRDTFDVNVDPNHPAVSCATHEACTDGANGRCIGNSHDGWYCSYDECFTDSECGADAVCQCEGGFRGDHNICLAGNCVTDSDCGDTGFCSPSFGDCGDYFGTIGWFCHTCDDECVNDADCGGDPSGFGQPYCMYDGAVGHWRCSNSHCAG